MGSKFEWVTTMEDKTIIFVKKACCQERLRLKHLKRIITDSKFDQIQSVTVDGKRYHKFVKVKNSIAKLVKSLNKLIKLCEELQDERRNENSSLSIKR